MKPTPFKVEVADAVLTDLTGRLKHTRWPSVHGGPAWSLGTSLPFMQQLRAYWLESFDWRKQEARLNSFEQYLVDIEGGRRLHYVIEKGSGANPRPLLLSHGWPGSFVEMLHLVQPLAHPERFGGLVSDAFTVVIPSLPGYGFSDPTPNPTSSQLIAADFNRLMVEVLKFERYYAHGGDWGSVITTRLGLKHSKNVAAIHVTMVGGMPDLEGPSLAEDEKAWIAKDSAWRVKEGAYALLQASKPLSISYGLTDSPIGLASWILEKFHGWTAPHSDSIVPHFFSLDDLLTNVMIYWLTGIASANSLYTSIYEQEGLTVRWFNRVQVPTRLILFPADLSGPPPKSWAQRLYANLTFGLAPSGGHFPALEQPTMLSQDIRSWFDGTQTL